MTRVDTLKKLGVVLHTCCGCGNPFSLRLAEMYVVTQADQTWQWQGPVACSMRCAVGHVEPGKCVVLASSVGRRGAPTVLAEHDGDGVQFRADGFERWKAGT